MTAEKKTNKYKGWWQSVGKRKTAVARVRLSDKEVDKGIIVNEKPLSTYFPYHVWQNIIISPLKILGLQNNYQVSVKVVGGGPKSQAEAVRHGIAKTLLAIDENYRKTLKAAGFLRRDPRVKERKKPGLKRARRGPQWSKR